MTEDIKISDMHCDGCVRSVRIAIEKLPIDKATVTIGNATVEYSNPSVTHDMIVKAIEAAGYHVVSTALIQIALHS